MAVLDDAVNSPSLQLAISRPGADIVGAVRKHISLEFWVWYHQNSDDIVVKRRIVMWSVVVRVRDLLPLFERIFGRDTFND